MRLFHKLRFGTASVLLLFCIGVTSFSYADTVLIVNSPGISFTGLDPKVTEAGIHCVIFDKNNQFLDSAHKLFTPADTPRGRQVVSGPFTIEATGNRQWFERAKGGRWECDAVVKSSEDVAVKRILQASHTLCNMPEHKWHCINNGSPSVLTATGQTTSSRQEE